MRTLLVATLAMLTACGGGGDGESITAESYPSKLHDAFCGLLVRCGAVADFETCLDTNLGLAFSASANELVAIDAGRSEFHPDNARACLAAFEQLSCDITSRAFRVLPDACSTTTTGKQADGATCVLNKECASTVCAVPQCPDACCFGTCVGDAPVIAHVGESCELANCDDESFCDVFGSLECVALQPADAFCIGFNECQYGLDCLPGQVCGALPGPGEPCIGPCRDIGTSCSPTSNTCVRAAVAGESCTTSAECSPYYSCDETKHCNPGLAVGATCNQSQRCAGDGAFCDPQDPQGNGVCSLRKPDGGSCSVGQMCESLYCDQATRMCAPEPLCIQQV